MEIGGIQKALVNLLSSIHTEYAITLFLYCKDGDLLKDVPSDVKIIEANPLLKLLGMSLEKSKTMGRVYYIIRAFLGGFSRMFGSRIPLAACIHSAKKMGPFDVAISYMQNAGSHVFYGGANDFVIHKVTAAHKATFLHCDFKHYEGNNSHNRKLYKKFDQIIAVSQSGKKAFLDCLPMLKDHATYAYNCYDYTRIDFLANQDPVLYDSHTFQIITLARLGAEKGIQRCIPIIKELTQMGFPFQWHIIGDGECRRAIEEEITKGQLSHIIYLHGQQSNPYRYLKNAHLLFVPSYHEGAPMVFFEAAHLGVPILSTDTSSAKELVEDTGYGWVCVNTEEEIQKALIKLLSQPLLYEETRQKMTSPQDNAMAIDQIHRLWKMT